MKEKQFENILKQKLENFEHEPSPEVYQRIHEQLHPKKKGIFLLFTLPIFVKYGVAASMAFALGMASMFYFNQNNNLNQVANNTSQNNSNQIVNQNSVNQSSNKIISADPSYSSTHPSVSSNYSSQVLKNTFATSNTKTQLNVLAQSNYVSQSEPSENIALINQSNLQTSNVTVYSLYNFQNLPSNDIEMVKVTEGFKDVRFEPKFKSRIGYTGFWFGPEISYQSKLIGKTYFMGSGLGLDYGYDFNPVFGLQSGFQYKLLLKDFKLQDTEGNVSYELVDFSAFNLPVSLRFKKSYFAENIERPVSWNTYVGMDYTRMSNLKMNQWGAHLGMEYDIFLKPEMMVTLGAKVGVSAIPDYEANAQIWGNSYQKVHTNIGIYSALRFVVPKQKN